MIIDRLPETEEMVMSVIWSFEKDLRACEITNLIKERFEREWKLQTTLTILSRLQTKGFISIYKDKGEYTRLYFFHHTEIQKEDYIQSRIKEMKDFWFGGSSETMKNFIDKV